jgi:ATP-dependent RNA helicase DDX42
LPTFAAVGRTLVFCATRQGVEALATAIRLVHPTTAGDDDNDTSLLLETLHGDKHQSDRKAALKAFSKGRVNVLIATDVAGRGLDIPHVATVINYDPAKNLDTHVHRVGRAGRLSTSGGEGAAQFEQGSAYTLLLPTQADFAHVLKSSFEREKRQVSPQLIELASQSKRSGNVESRTKWNKTGLGFADATSSTYGPGGGGGGGAEMRSNPSISIPPQQQQQQPSPSKRKSRWG